MKTKARQRLEAHLVYLEARNETLENTVANGRTMFDQLSNTCNNQLAELRALREECAKLRMSEGEQHQ